MAAPDNKNILNTLGVLCREQLPVALMSRDLLVVCHGRFTDLGEDALTLAFDIRPAGLGFSPPAFCIGSFNLESRPHLFTTRVKRNPEIESDGPSVLQVEIPGAMRWPESRMAVRLPVPPSAPLRMRVRSATAEFEVSARDISLCGALVQCVGDDAPLLSAGERIAVELELNGQTVQMPAIIRRRAPPRYGLYFPNSVTEGRLDPPRAWRKMIDAVARYA